MKCQLSIGMARRRSKEIPLYAYGYGLVCEDCLEANPNNTKLLNTQCSPSHKSSNVVLVHVAINDEAGAQGMLERIRPLPKSLPSGWFILCNDADRSCNRGDSCTYAHSKAELKAWNAQLIRDDSKSRTSSDDWMRESIRPLPKRLTPGKRISLCNNADRSCNFGDNCMFPHSKAELKAWNLQLAESEDDSEGVNKPTMRPPFKHKISSQQQVPAQGGRSRSHSESSEGRPERRASTPKPQVDHPDSQSSSPNPKCHPASEGSPLSTENYKSKFTELLKLDEIEHKKVLDENCNREYDLFLGTEPPSALRRSPDNRYCCYGYLKDISGHQVAYATQSSQGSIYILNLDQMYFCKADILRDNYTHTEEKLYIGFEAQELQHGFPGARSRGLTRIRVVVKFTVKHLYFRNLKSCVSKAAVPIIQKIVPSPCTFSQEPIDIGIGLKPYETLCSPDQLAALEAILTSSPRGPPNIIVGPFGSGKTRLLAMAASCFFAEARIQQQPASILVCTHQRESVDNFYDHYQHFMTGKEEDVEVIILRDRGFKHISTDSTVYKTIQGFLDVQKNRLAMSTCMMVPELVKHIGDRFFTHILIDEGAQMREPEAIAPLSLAHPDTTKIVIAGDQHQVGPAMLVFGEVPSSCGLATSLLERLHSTYKCLRQESYISTLVTDYHSHPDIFELPSSLFYETPLIAPFDRDPPSLHPLYPYPLVFVCSNIDQVVTQVDDSVNEVEAGILLDEVNEFAIAKKWPTASWGPQDKVMSQTCIMSSSRSQLTMINQLIRHKTLSGKLKTIQRLPTYDIQGNEFRALFLSTSEQTNSDASSRDPTKSLCNPHLFNTAVTRAQSLVVAIGNPFLLLKTEQTMLEKYGTKGEVWSNYLKRCLKHKTCVFPPSLNLNRKKAKAIRLLLEAELDDEADDEAVPDGTSNEAADEGDFPFPSQDDVKPSISTQNNSGTSAKAASRLDDFKIKGQIGKGGFGVVFHVEHTTDKGEYALKIIRLSDNPKKQDKVLREVRNLAKLAEHSNIVRYHTSWKERAPDEWAKKKLWSLLESSDSLQTALIPITTAVGSTSTTSSSPHTTNTSTSTHVVSSDLCQGGFGPTCRSADSVVSFRDSADSPSGHSQFKIFKSTALETAKIQPARSQDPPTCLFIQTELCERDTLRNWLNKNCKEKSRNKGQILTFFKQILDALVYIHGEGFVHRDLKPSNIFFSRSKGHCLKIGDFGLAKTVTMPHGAPTGVDTTNHGSMDSHSKGSMQAGTLLYMSPEQFKGEKCDEKSDMFALGIILFELHYIMEARLQVLSALRILEFPPHFEENHLNVTKVVKLLLATYSERPTCHDLAKHEYFQNLLTEVSIDDYIPRL